MSPALIFFLLTTGVPAEEVSYAKAISEAQMYSRIAESHMWNLGQQTAQADVCHALGDAVTTWTLAAEWYEKARTAPSHDSERLSDEALKEKVMTEKAKAKNTHDYFEQTCR